MRQPDAALHADRRDRILAAAERVFAAHGFHGASMQDIAAAAEMSPGNLYRYFSSKDAIIEAFAERDRQESAAAFAAIAAEARIVDGLLAAFRRHVLEESPARIVVGLDVLAETQRNPAVAGSVEAADRAVRSDFRDVLARARDDGRLRADLDADAAAVLLLALADGLLARRLLQPDLDVARLTAGLRDLLQRYLEGTTR